MNAGFWPRALRGLELIGEPLQRVVRRARRERASLDVAAARGRGESLAPAGHGDSPAPCFGTGPVLFSKPKIYGDRIQQAREIKGLSLDTLSHWCGIELLELAAFEAGHSEPSPGVLQSIALRTGFPVRWFRRPPGPGFTPCSLRYEPDVVTAPGETLLEVLAGRGIPLAELAAQLDTTEEVAAAIATGEAPLTAALALGLERALDIPAAFWVQLEKNYRINLQKMPDFRPESR